MKELIKTILDDLPSGVWATDKEDRVVYINKAMTAIAGASAEQFVGLYVFKDLDKPGNKEFLASYRKVKTNLFPGEYEVRLKDSEGKGFVHRGWLTPMIKDDKYDGMIVTAEDITEKDIFEKALRESEERFRRLIEFGADGIVLGSNEGIITEVNQAACDILGIKRSVLIGKHISFIPFTKESLEKTPFRFDLLQQGHTVISERTVIKPDGTGIETEMKTKMMTDGTYQAIFRDITEKKNNEKQIREFSRSLEQKVSERTMQLQNLNKELESFSYSVSHDLRAPVRHISGFTDILAKKIGQENEEINSTIKKISTAACKMERLIDDLLEFSKTGRIELSKNKVDLNILVNSVKKDLCDNLPGRNIEWKISELPPVYCDRNLIRIVWENLIGNACKYTVNSDPSVIEIGCLNRDDIMEFFVKDNGIGFDMEHYDKLFGVFQRLHNEIDFPGTGIGLATVKRIITRHRGSIRAESEGEGKGACFYFTLPKTKEAAV
jgi:PAS domain S-box-containing protein